MPGDYSRFTDDLKKRFAKLLMQQGKVQLDSDWNELVDILTRRDRLQAADAMGPLAVPRATTKDAFRITQSGLDLLIGPGRMYVDGVLAEAFAKDGKGGNTLTYANQPFFVDPPPAMPAGKGLLYLDVWDRELTSVEDPSLLDVALGGIDTATRMQTVWQVRFTDDAKLNCDSDLNAKFPPSNGQLSVSVLPPKDDPDPCQLPETGGFQDVENRHYRVEIHDVSVNPPTFKFARDPVVTEIDAMDLADPNAPVLSVRRTGRDPVLRFQKNDFAEVVNDRHVLHGLPGIMVKVDFVDEALQEITIKNAGGLPAVADVDPALHPRLIRWDQKSAPLLSATGTVALEAGVQVTFSGGTLFHNRDYWTFPARAANRTVGPMDKELPRGIVHHYAPLAMFDPAGAPVIRTDCRTLWPPDFDCECAACVTEEEHNSGRHTIHMAIAEVKKKGGGKVCLQPGTYILDKPLQIVNNNFITLTGHGNVWLIYLGDEPEAILIQLSIDVVIEGITLARLGLTSKNVDTAAITIRDCLLEVTVQDCVIWTPSGSLLLSNHGSCIALDGFLWMVNVHDCLLVGGVAVGMIGGATIPKPRTLTLARANVYDNVMFCGYAGVMLHALGLAVTIRHNWIDAAETDCVWLEGTTEPHRSNLIDGNWVFARHLGIAVNADQTTISNNVIRGTFDPAHASGADAKPEFSAIAVYTETDGDELHECQVIGNRISRILGMGVQVAGRAIGLMIKQNFISDTALGAIVVTQKASRSQLSIENNDIRNVALWQPEPGKPARIAAAIDVSPHCDSAITTNTIDTVGLEPVAGRAQLQSAGILVFSPTSTRIDGNRISGVFPSLGTNAAGIGDFSAGIDIVGPLGVVEVTNNIVRTGPKEKSKLSSPNVTPAAPAPQIGGHVHALRIRTARIANDFTWFDLVAITVSAKATKKARAKAAVATERVGETRATFPSGSVLESRIGFLWDIGNFFWFHILLPGAAVIVRANQFFTLDEVRDSKFFMVDISDFSEGCTYGGNVCVADPKFFISGTRIQTQTVVADSNQLFGHSSPSLRIDTPFGDQWTVLGNIAESVIEVNGPNIKTLDPWGKLNRSS